MSAKPQLILGPIVGGLSDRRANLWARANSTSTLYAWIGKKPDLSDGALKGQPQALVPEDGCAGAVRVEGLKPETRYYYALMLTKERPRGTAGSFPSFKTFPAPGSRQSFSFAFSSCFRPENADGGRIFDALDRQRKEEDLRFLLMTGDQIYADQRKHNSLGRLAITLDDYRRVYEYTWSRPRFRAAMQNLPAFMVMDDHEVDNDWHWDDPGRRWAHLPFYEYLLRWFFRRPKDEFLITLHRIRDALQAYWEHQGIHAPTGPHPAAMDRSGRFVLQNDTGNLAYTFVFGAAAFFVMDTRTMRIESTRGNSLLGETQWRDLEAWLLDAKDRYPLKFIVSSSTVLFDMLIDLPSDRWKGFAGERQRLFDFIAQNEIEGVHLLTGDIHSAHAISVDVRTPGGRSLPVWEFCATPFEQGTNRIKFTYFAPRIRNVANQRLYFAIAKHNYGVVRVDFAEGGKPHVHFSVRGDDGETLGSVGGG